MDTTASGEEIAMDTGGADESSGGQDESGGPGAGEKPYSSLDFPWPLGFTKCTTVENEEETKQPSHQPGDISVSSDTYDMNHKRRGFAVIINQENFNSELRLQGFGQRTGTNVDARNLKDRLQALGFFVQPYYNLNANSIKIALARMAAEDHSDADCFVCVILSHGEEGIVFGTDKALEIKELAAFFKGDKCPGLVGKPKIFIIQACRGYQTDAGVPVNVVDALPMEAEELPLATQYIKLPVEADFLFAYSTVPGYYSWRNGMHGSWYVQALSEMLEKYGETMEIQKLLTKAHQMVSQNFESQSDQPGFYKMKQVPSMVSMLTKDLYFRKKHKPSRSRPR